MTYVVSYIYQKYYSFWSTHLVVFEWYSKGVQIIVVFLKINHKLHYKITAQWKQNWTPFFIMLYIMKISTWMADLSLPSI